MNVEIREFDSSDDYSLYRVNMSEEFELKDKEFSVNHIFVKVTYNESGEPVIEFSKHGSQREKEIPDEKWDEIKKKVKLKL